MDADSAADRTDEPLSIGTVVARLRGEFPDVSPSALRFLERSGLLSATRTAGGHRLYTSADVERIRRIKSWQRERLSLAEIRQRLEDADRLASPDVLADAFLRLALAGDRAAAFHIVAAADELGLPLEQTFGAVIQPALTELGRRWETGEVLVAQEKEVSELVRDLVAELSRRHAQPRPEGPTLVAACVEGERHELGLRMACGLLRERGCAVHFLGADVAPRFVLEAVRLHRPDAVLLSVHLAVNLPAVKDAVEVLTIGLAPRLPPPIVAGGMAAIGRPDAIRGWGAIPVSRPQPSAAPGVLGDLPGLLDEIVSGG